MLRKHSLSLAGVIVALMTPGVARALPVTGFQEERTPIGAIERNRLALATIAVDGVNLEASGTAVGAPTEAALAQLASARQAGLRSALVSGNFDDSIEDFSEARAHLLLESPSATSTVVATLAHTVVSEGWDGVNVDLEALEPRDTSGLTRFMRSLRAALGPTRTLSIDLTNGTTAAHFAACGYNLRALGRVVNTVVLMGYDEHGPWEKTAGPVGALSWQRAGLAVLERYVPRFKIELGVAGYGYAWRPHSRATLSDPEARALVRAAHARARWNAAAGEWTARLGDGSTLWWSDARSYRIRVALARSEHLHGLAVWALGLSDTLPAV